METLSNYTPYKAPRFNFEESFDHAAFHTWIIENWTLSFWYSVAYVVVIFAGIRYMRDRPRFDLRPLLILWSTLLAIFSIFGAVRTIPELYYMLDKYGLEASICDPSNFYGHSAIWSYLFAVSKVYEFGDTAFIVLRKQQLSFLHWYHHVTVLIYVWYSYTDYTAPGRWFGVMNYTVHGFMYTYYALKAMRINVPRAVNIFITTIQISQMLMGLVVIGKAYLAKSQGRYCQQTYENMTWCSLMYLSYLVLFLSFFHQTYLAPKPPTNKVDSYEKPGHASYSNGVHANGVVDKKRR